MPVKEFDFFDPAYLRSADCAEQFARLRRDSPISWHEGSEGGFWVVTKHADVIAISSDPQTFSSKSGVFIYDHPANSDGALLFTDPPEHRRLRRFVTSYFMGRGVARLEPWVRAECQALFRRALDRRHVDVIAELAVDLPLNTISEMMKLPPRERRRLLALSDELASAGASGGDRATRAIMAMSEFGVDMAHERRKERGDDLLSTMLDVTGGEGEPLSDQELGMMFMQIAGAATDTTRGVIGDIALRFARDADLYEKVRAEPSLIRGMIEEVLRVSPPIYYMRRTATRDTSVGGKTIRRGERVLMYYLSANFDEDVFRDPERFDVHRSPNPHLSFGFGEHVCLGLNVARLEIRVFVEEFVKHITSVGLDGPVVQDFNTESTRYQSIPVIVA